jgi:hypothetical protein
MGSHNPPKSLFPSFKRRLRKGTKLLLKSMIREFSEAAACAKEEKQYGPVMTALTAKAKLAGLWVDRAENINGNYAISDKPLSEQEWVEKHVKY